MNECRIPVYVVNLLRDNHKREHMSAICKSNGLDCHFFDAIDGKSLSEQFIDDITDNYLSISEIARTLTRGELGCSLSHLGIYKKIVNDDIRVALIMEDDVDIDENINAFLDSIDKLPVSWDICLLGHYSRERDEKETLSSYRVNKKITEKHTITRLVERAYGTHGYLISNNGAKKLLKLLTKIIRPIDHYTCVDKHINLYAVKPRLIRVNKELQACSSLESERNKLRGRYSEATVSGSCIKTLIRGIADITGLIYLKRWLKKILVRSKKLRPYSDL